MNKRLYILLAFLVGCATTGTGPGPTATSSNSVSNKPAANAPKPDKLENIALVWKPTTSVGSMGTIDLTDLEKAKLQVDRFADNRENRGFIGQNSEKQVPRKVTTPDDVSAFISNHMKSLMEGAGINVVDSGGTAILKGEIKQFFVNETELYKGDVRLRLTLTNPAGKVLWTGTTGGTANRFGRSYKAENYYESLSDSLIDVTYHLMQDAGFRKALAGK